MSETALLEVMNTAIWTATTCAGPLLAIGGVVGLLMALVQAATQLSEPALTFVPKLAALGGTLMWLGPWLLQQLVAFNVEMYEAIALMGPGTH